MGHIHLKVGDIPQAKQFYEDILLFEEMNNRDDALFISRDRYHHHLGMNTWESAGAGKRIENTYGLRSFEIIYQDQYLYEQVRNNLRKNGSPIEIIPPSSIKTLDPWGNQIILRLGLR
jgi:catechol 2,3-dioxygenase